MTVKVYEITKWGDLTMSYRRTLAIKGIAILMVILGHMSLIDTSGAWGVHLFLILSGYGIYCSYESYGLTNYWKKKIVNVWIPYFICITISIFFRFLTGESFSIKNVIASLVGIDFGFNVDPTMWYISYIFAWYGIFWILLTSKNNMIRILLFGGLEIVISILGFLSIAWNHGTIAWAYSFSFPIGMLIGKFRNYPIKEHKKNLVLLLFSIFSGGYVFVNYGNPHSGFGLLGITIIAALGILSFSNLVRIELIPIIGGGSKFLENGPILCI